MQKVLVIDKHVTCTDCGNMMEVIQHQRDGAEYASRWTEEEIRTNMAKLMYAWVNDSGLDDSWHTRDELVGAIVKHYPKFTNKARLSEAVGCHLVLVDKKPADPLYTLNRSRVIQIFPQLDKWHPETIKKDTGSKTGHANTWSD